MEVSSIKANVMSQELEQFSGQVQEEEIVGLHLSLVEKQKLISEKEAQFSQQEAELLSLKQHLSDRLKDSGEKDLNAIKETVALVQRQPEIQKNTATIDTKCC